MSLGQLNSKNFNFSFKREGVNKKQTFKQAAGISCCSIRVQNLFGLDQIEGREVSVNHPSNLLDQSSHTSCFIGSFQESYQQNSNW